MTAHAQKAQSNIPEQSTEERIRQVMSKRIVILDGAYGVLSKGMILRKRSSAVIDLPIMQCH
jgi:hypothetical protein